MNKTFKIESNENFYKYMKGIIADLDERLKISTKSTLDNLNSLENDYNLNIPETLKDLYSIFDGEDTKNFLGLILGFSLLSSKEILEQIKGFYTMDFEFISMKTDYIKDGDLKNKIPLAFDGSRCFIALDMNPGKKGKIGQVITVDFDYNQYYLLADSLEDFYVFIKK